MAQKVHPKIFRTGIIYGWDSKWFAKRDFASLLREDQKIKTYLRTKLREASVDRIEIERTARALTVTIHSGKPGMIIGRGGAGIEELRTTLRKMAGGKNDAKFLLNLNVVEVGRPGLSAALVAQSMVADTEKRMPFRRVLKQHLDRVQKAGAKGVKIVISGRLNGAEIARTEKLSWGSVPLQNLRADVDFARETARTLYGTIGVKVWIYRGEVFDGKDPRAAMAAAAPQRDRRPMRGPRA